MKTIRRLASNFAGYLLLGHIYLMSFIIAIALMLPSDDALAANASVPDTLQACLRKAEQFPDIGAAEAERWFKQGGGEEARLCHAAAQFNRGEFTLAGRGFASLALLHDKNDPKRAAQLHSRAGLSFMRADDAKTAEAEYAAALKEEPDDPDIWLDRATGRAGVERYWEALDDLNHALRIMPDMVDALRLRGHVWLQLGDKKNAEQDFVRAEDIEARDKAKPKP